MDQVRRMNKLSAQGVVDRIKAQCSATWKDSPADVLMRVSRDVVVKGIATSYTPLIEVLKKAVAAGKNLIITQQPAYYSETEEYLKNDPAFLYKKNSLAKITWCYGDFTITETDEKWTANCLDWQKRWAGINIIFTKQADKLSRGRVNILICLKVR